MVFNKIDLASETRRLELRGLEPRAVEVSSRSGEGIDELLARIASELPEPDVDVRVLIPYNHGELVSRLHLNGRIIELDYREDGTFVHAMAKPDLAADLAPYSTKLLPTRD